MSMTRKDYVMVAAVIKNRQLDMTATERTEAYNNALRASALDMADVFRRDNASFDRQRFLTACGVSE